MELDLGLGRVRVTVRIWTSGLAHAQLPAAFCCVAAKQSTANYGNNGGKQCGADLREWAMAGQSKSDEILNGVKNELTRRGILTISSQNRMRGVLAH
eukprot:6203809-Pleurochrysis_carterae.AAC.1